jgi:PAS domain S-box-containing protein
MYEDGVPVGIQGIARDVTERKRTLAELRASEDRFGTLVKSAQDIIYSHDFEGNYTSINEIGCRLSGYSAEEVLSMNIADSLTPESVETALKMIDIHLSGQEAPYHRAEIVRKDGSHFPVEIKSWLTYRDGVPYGVEGIARDITERIELEDKLRQSQKLEAVGLLAGGIAHDFNNLLTVITGYSDLTLKRMPAEDPVRKNIEQIKDAGARAAELTGQLLAFSRKQVLKPTVHNLNSVITNIERMLKRIIRESVELKTDLAPDLSNIKADPGQIEQVIMNLAVNARDAMPNGGILTISTCNVSRGPEVLNIQDTCQPGEYVKMTVSDTGEGMSDETKRRMFEPFFTTKELGKGTGLGLATVHGIVKQSGGEIRVSSVVGEGTTFDIFFPCVDDEQEKQQWADRDVIDHSGTETILVVEDDANLRELVKTILVPNGYNVLSAADGSAALEICRTCPGQIHLLLTDVVMPQMSGITVRDRVVELLPDIKVLFMSGYIEESPSDKKLLKTGDALIQKPFNPDSLSKKVREILDAKQE